MLIIKISINETLTLKQIKKKEVIKRDEDKKYNATMAAIERAAASAMNRDLNDNPSLKGQYGNTEKVQTAASLGT